MILVINTFLFNNGKTSKNRLFLEVVMRKSETGRAVLKKIPVVLCVFALCAGMVFSQEEEIPPSVLSVNSFGYVSFEPLQMVLPGDGDPSFYAGSGVPWGDKSKITLLFQLTEPQWRFGGKIGLEKEYGEEITPRVIDTASVWLRPFQWTQIEVGSFEYEEYQGNYSGTDFSLYLGPAEENEGSIFQKMKGVNGTGVMLSFFPVKNLFLGFLINPLIGARADNYDRQPVTAQDIYGNGQYGAAYTFEGIGTARIQYIGGAKTHPNLAVFIESYDTVFDIARWENDNTDSSGNPLPPDYDNTDYYITKPVYNRFP